MKNEVIYRKIDSGKAGEKQKVSARMRWKYYILIEEKYYTTLHILMIISISQLEWSRVEYIFELNSFRK